MKNAMSFSPTTTTKTTEVTAVDIPTMGKMSIAEYRKYLEHGLLATDHHDVLRSEPAGYPLAVTGEQLRELIAYLQRLCEDTKE